MLFKIWCLNIIFRKFFIPVFKMQTMLFSDIFVSKLKSIGPINLTNINWISLSLSRFLFISLPPIRHPLTLTEEQKLKNCHDHVAKEKERKKNTNPKKKKKKKPKPMGLSLILMWVPVLVEWFRCNFMTCKIGLWEWVERKGRRRGSVRMCAAVGMGGPWAKTLPL